MKQTIKNLLIMLAIGILFALFINVNVCIDCSTTRGEIMNNVTGYTACGMILSFGWHLKTFVEAVKEASSKIKKTK